MIRLYATCKQFLPKPLLAAVVFFVVMFAVFSPVFSQIVEAQTFGCRVLVRMPDFYECTSRRPYNTIAECLASGCILGGCVPYDQCSEGHVRTVDKVANESSAGSIVGGFVGGVIIRSLIEILEAINYMLTIVVAWFAQLFDGVVAISLAGLSGIDAVTRGWTITRDIANIFFIFALLVIAIATILRLESYGAKQLLPKLIIAALLINFSLVIAFAVVDASNILALAFINEIGTPSVSNSIATVLQLGKITDTTSINGEHIDIDPKNSLSAGMETTIKSQLNQEFTNDPAIITPTPALQNKENNNVIRLFWQATILILQLTLMFVFVALSVMLLIRSVALIMLFVLAPLGFLASVLPATRTYSNKWWQKLFEWSFFFPASAFMIYLAIAFGAQMSQALNGGGGGNHVINTGVLFSYFATVAFLMGSLVVAKQMGIVGAAAAVGIGVGMAKAVRGYAGRTSMAGLRAVGRPIQQGAGAASNAFLESKAAQRLSNVPLLRQTLRIPAAIAQKRETVAKDEAKRIANLPAKQQAIMLKTLRSDAQAKAFDAMNEKQQVRVVQAMTPENKIEFYDRMKPFDLEKDVAKATGNLHQAMQMMHPEYRTKKVGDMASTDTTYQQRANDYLGDLSNEQMRKMDGESIGENIFFQKYLASNARNFNDVTNNREQILGTQQMLHNLIREFGILIQNQSPANIADELATKIEDLNGPYKNDQLAKQIRANIGINIIANPSLVGVRSKRGNINVVGAAPAGGTP